MKWYPFSSDYGRGWQLVDHRNNPIGSVKPIHFGVRDRDGVTAHFSNVRQAVYYAWQLKE